MENKKLFNMVALNLVIIYITGIIGISCTAKSERQLFLLLTPLNLLITTFSSLLFHRQRDLKFYLLALFIFLSGFFIEVIGVKTGLIFGQYHYGQTLGTALLDVPLVIGLNWFLLVYSIGTVFYTIRNTLLYCLLSAATMTLLDILIEPIAIRLDFWQWQDNSIPFQNYLAWFVISFVLFYLFRMMNGREGNRFSKVVLVVLFSFFGILNLILR